MLSSVLYGRIGTGVMTWIINTGSKLSNWPNTYFKIRRMTCYQFFAYACSYQTVLKGFKPCRCNQFCPECSVAKSKVESSKHRWICSDYAITSFQWTSIVAVRYGDTITAPKTYFYKNIHFLYRAQVSFASEAHVRTWNHRVSGS